jgi:hypothetical protein
MQRKRHMGSLAPARQGRPPGGGKLAPYASFLIQTVEAEPAITMPELAAWLREQHGVVAAPAMLSRVLCRRGFSFKKCPDGGGVRTRRRGGRAPGLARPASAAHAPEAAPAGILRRDLRQHQDDAPARALAPRPAAAHERTPSATGRRIPLWPVCGVTN